MILKKKLLTISIGLIALMQTAVSTQQDNEKNLKEKITHDQKATLILNIKNIKYQGVLFAAVYDNEEAFEANSEGQKGIEEMADAAMKKTHKGQTLTLTFSNLAYGDYAIRLFLDKNDNGKLDQGLFGIPLEQYASSGENPMIPKYEKCRFKLSGKKTVFSVKMR